ncbi:MAG: 7-carboxy-7-deazaguanine synthase QueE [Planctomycetaceae bacterium]|nr:7-carboxy-7-deazaguanine synthase QueE [Planctomycetales bacterium]MCB9920820.1 7-carboxy-7-deazaguanine synthase QueE [Planctomycetaceae bacterium]
MRIAEIYKSVQGEGFLTGTESIFVRTSGCNLRCWYCDTPFTSWRPEGDDLEIDEILHQVAKLNCSHVVVTGGEPMLFAELIPLCGGLRDMNCHITIETAGTLYLPVECDLMSVSPKLANSTPSVELDAKWHDRHERSRHVPDVMRRLVDEYRYQLKFVVDQPADCDELEQYLDGLPEIKQDRVMLMPQGTDCERLEQTGAWLKEYCAKHGYRFCARRHIELYGFTRGT